MFKYHSWQCLPSAAELPDSDDTPVDNELQNLIPNLLEETLSHCWSIRQDWFFGVDMGIYYAPSVPAIVPDGFLSLGVERFIHEDGRLSYVLWEEDNVPPIFALEVISRTYGKEYEQKKALYAEIGILYYAIYIPNRHYRRNRDPLELYRLENNEYVRLPASNLPTPSQEQFWLPEIGLALGRERGTYRGRTREWLYWYTADGDRLLTPEENAEQEYQRAEQEYQRAEQEHQRAERLAARLRELGIDPD
ncbi:MAG: Uma2 family endonuclease [Elainella sp. Prado103]|jgi:Uma2 family endonuclease|nr:Uma2 family endonuclease [Elainella sp. Prado103]